MRIAIVGAGGHGKVVADAILARNADHLAGFLDDDSSLWGRTHFGFPILGPTDSWQTHSIDAIVVGIGENMARKRQFDKLKAAGAKLATVVHPQATLGKGVVLGEGVVAFAHVVVNPDTHVGANTILNTASTVDHDCVIGAHCHLAPGVRIAGEVTLGEGVFAGIGAVVIPGLSIGRWSVIGAGAVVIRDAAESAKLVGVPAKAV
jgi:sugar O-acyltransferase (sialic acid O-acetyltransferase NeuD family)